MEELKQQVTGLTVKVESILEKIEYLNHQIAEILSEMSLNTTESMNFSDRSEGIGRYPYREKIQSNAVMQHKDVLADNEYLHQGNHNTNKPLSPEIQIQRLTAQLTAAYNRIAALEEQLLACRIH